MRIRRITATPVNLPLEAPYIWVFGELAGFSVTIVEVETEDGLVGLGEAPTLIVHETIGQVRSKVL
jgi:glucarate dehydratase